MMPSHGHIHSAVWQPMIHDRDSGHPGPRSALVGDQPSADFRWGPRPYPQDHCIPIAEGAPSYIDAESCLSVYPEGPTLANPSLGDQRERRRLHEPAWLDRSRRPQYDNVLNQPTRLSHAAPFEARGEPPLSQRQHHYITATCPCGIPNCRASAIGEYFNQHPERREQAVQATLDFSFDRIGFTVMDGTSATWIGQPADDTPPPLSDKPMPRRTTERKKHLPATTQSEHDASRQILSAAKALAGRVLASRKRPAVYRPDIDELSPGKSVEAEPKPKPANRSKEAGSQKSSSSSKASGSSIKSSSSFNGSYSSKRSNTLVAGAETDVGEGSTLGINLLMSD